MSGVQRPNSLTLVVDLTRRLAEEFDTLPIPTVTTAVRSAANAATLFGSGVAGSLELIEKIAREDLIAVRGAAEEQARIALAG